MGPETKRNRERACFAFSVGLDYLSSSRTPIRAFTFQTSIFWFCLLPSPVDSTILVLPKRYELPDVLVRRASVRSNSPWKSVP